MLNQRTYNSDKGKHLKSNLGYEQKDTESPMCEAEILLHVLQGNPTCNDAYVNIQWEPDRNYYQWRKILLL